MIMAKKRRVLFFIDSLTCGGAEKSLVSLLPLLDYTRLDVDLMLTTSGGVFEQYVPQDVRVISLPKAHGIRKFWYFCCQLYFSLLLRGFHVLKKKKHGAEIYWMAMKSAYAPLKDRYDVAVAYQQGFPTYYVSMKVKAGKKYAWINTDLPKAGYDRHFNKCFYDRLSGVIPVSDALCENLGKNSFVDNTKIYAIYDILNTKLIHQMATEVIPLSRIKDVFRIVTVGRMEFPKNYPLAVRTAKLLKNAGIKFQWYFIGDGSARQNVERLISQYALEDDVFLLGLVENPYPYMQMCDIYVQSSRFEGYALTIREARSLYKPIVATANSVLYDAHFRDGENGLIADMTEESLAEKIMLLVNNPELRDFLSTNSRKEMDLTAITESKKVNDLLLA